jgi:hypothetical protein
MSIHPKHSISVTETNRGHITFETEEQVEAWMENPDYSLVEWTWKDRDYTYFQHDAQDDDIEFVEIEVTQ